MSTNTLMTIWILGAIFLSLASIIYLAYENQANGKDNGFGNIVSAIALSLFWPILLPSGIVIVSMTLLWMGLNDFIAFLIEQNRKRNENKEKLLESKILNGLELDNLLTEQYKEKQGWK